MQLFVYNFLNGLKGIHKKLKLILNHYVTKTKQNMDLMPFVQSRFRISIKKNFNESIKTYVETKLPYIMSDLERPFVLREKLFRLVNCLQYSFEITNDFSYIPLLENEENTKTILDIYNLIVRIETCDTTRNAEKCPVCWERYTKANTYHSTVCQHILCGDCKNKCTRCPLCRKNYIKPK